MLFSFNSILAVTSMVGAVAGHGIITKPWPRAPGAASLAACGPNVTNNIKGDNTSHVEDLPEAGALDPKYHADKCNLWLCRGLQYADNKEHVVSYKAGQKVDMEVYLRIKHFGSANVSIVDTKTNKIISPNLVYWAKYADEKKATVPAEEKFSFKIPKNLGSKCATAGDCVIQRWWYGTGAKQTYESCVDFTVAAPMVMNKRFRRV
ncbi:related to chitin binding protein [Rhynchosporium graminicola]|uniref:Related to chitin binding protein n=1 Tax=Rhynchosporium graminicola TaxID=2792576 RepID=A0A1E1KAD2_9HELO|nr:related to chitin binding protein [Rhynchosporium commune]